MAGRDNTEAFEGMRAVKELIGPMLQMLDQIFNKSLPVAQSLLNASQELADELMSLLQLDPALFKEALDSFKVQINDTLDKDIDFLSRQSVESFATDFRLAAELLRNDVAEHSKDPLNMSKEDIKRVSQGMAALSQIQHDLRDANAKFIQHGDVSVFRTARDRASAVLAHSPVAKTLDQAKNEREAVTADKSKSFDERAESAKKAAAEYNASRPQRSMSITRPNLEKN